MYGFEDERCTGRRVRFEDKGLTHEGVVKSHSFINEEYDPDHIIVHIEDRINRIEAKNADKKYWAGHGKLQIVCDEGKTFIKDYDSVTFLE